jgi:prevent-host-death family protein
MADVALRDLRKDTSSVLRRVEEGERLRITVSGGRPVAEIVPLPRRRRFISWAALSQTLSTARADARLAVKLFSALTGHPSCQSSQPLPA